MTVEINELISNEPAENGQQGGGLGQPNPLTTDEVIRRGQEAMERKRRSFDDWMLIAEALQVGRTEVMRVLHTNKPTGARYEKAMGEWLFTRSFHLIDKCTRNHLLECLRHRIEIAKWRAALTEAERFNFNHPTNVLRKWKSRDRRSSSKRSAESFGVRQIERGEYRAAGKASPRRARDRPWRW